MTQAIQVTDTLVLKPWRLASQVLSLVLLVLALATFSARNPLADDADEIDGAATFVRGFGDNALATLSDQTLDEEARSREFRRLLTSGFHLDLIGRFVLGRYWRRASEAEQAEFRELFEGYIVASYARQLSGYQSEQLVIDGGRPKGKSGALVTSRIARPEDEPFHVEWRLRRDNTGWKIIDVIVEGVSMAVTHRSEFSAVIAERGGGVGGLLDVLRSKADSPQTQASAGNAGTL